MLRRKKSKADVVRDRATDLWGDASEMAGKAADSLAPRLEEARDEITPKVNAAIDRTRDEFVPAVAESLGKTRLAETRLAETPFVDAPKKKKKHRLRNLLILAGLAGAAAYAYKWFCADSGGTYSAPAPTPPPSRPTAVPGDSEDAAPRHAAPASEGGSGAGSDNPATEKGSDTTQSDPTDRS